MYVCVPVDLSDWLLLLFFMQVLVLGAHSLFTAEDARSQRQRWVQGGSAVNPCCDGLVYLLGYTGSV